MATCGLYLLVFLGTVALGFILPRMATRFGLVDEPDHRKLHEGSIPLVGGLMIFISYASILGVEGYLKPSVFIALVAMLLLGLVDDHVGLSARCRMFLQSMIVLALILTGDVKLTQLGNLAGMGVVNLGTLAVPFTLLCFVGLINAINMLDGLDGLAGGVVLSALIWLAIANVLTGAGFCNEGFALIGALAGFLVFNARYPGHPKATIYMGDAGSTTLGLVLGYIALNQCANQTAPLTPVSIFWVLALPVVDTLRVMIVRKLRGHSPFAADRTHLHHLMSDLGHFSAGAVAWSLVMLNLVFGAVGVLGHYFGIQDSWLMLGILVLLVSSVIVGYFLERMPSKAVAAEQSMHEVTI